MSWGNKSFLLKSVVVTLLLIAVSASAQQKSTTSVSEIAPEEPFKRWELQLIGNLGTNLYEDSSYSKSSSMDLWILPKIFFKDQTKLSIISILSREISEEHKTKFATTRVEYSMKPIEGKLLNVTPAPSIVLPTDYELYEKDTFRGALSMTFGLGIKLPTDKLSLGYSPRFTKNFHEYNTNAAHKTNLEYTIRHRGTAAYSLTGKLSISLLADFVQGWSYRGIPRQSFAMGQDLSYAIKPNLIVSVGHSNEGSAKREGGAGSNIKAFNDRTSEIGIGLDYTF